MVRVVSALTIIASIAAANAFKIVAWESPNYAGKAFQTSLTGTHAIGFWAKSYVWDSPEHDGCCIRFCANNRETGYWCQAHNNANVVPANQFNKVVTGCGSDVLRC